MSSERNIDPFAVIILVASLVGIILLAVFDFAALDLGGGTIRYSCLTCEYASGGDLVAQVFVLILLIIQIVIVLNDLLPKKFIEKDLDKYGMLLSVLTIVFVVIGIGAFGITYSNFEWWPETGFYGVIIAGLLNSILFFLKFKNR